MLVRDFHPNRFVAPAEIVQKIQRRYVEYFPDGGTVVDLGCGQGVFLELLRVSGRTGIGVDLTKQFVDGIKSRGMYAVRQDVFAFLRRNKAEFDGVFASHLIEHFSAEQGLELIQLMHDSLKPNGVMILMTPAYNDILVSAERFWLDISHVRPYPLLLLREVFHHVGLTIVDAGNDPSTKLRGSFRKPHVIFRNVIYKIRFGKYYNAGDTYIVGRKEGKP